MELIVYLILIGVGVLALFVWNNYQSNGRIVTATSLTRREVVEEAIRYFAPGGWKVEERGRDFVLMRRGPSGCGALLFLVLFFPLGLVYLFTDWGKGTLTVNCSENDEGGTDVQFDWKNAGKRGSVMRLAKWFEQQDDDGDEGDSRQVKDA